MSKVDVDTGWAWLVLVAVYTGRIILSTSLFMSGIFYVALLEYYHSDATKTSIIGSLNSGLLCLCGPFVSILIDKYSCRVCMVLGGILLTLSYLISAFVNNVDNLILTLGVIGGIGNSMASVPFSVTLGHYFNKRRNIVISLSMAVIGLGMFIASPFSLYLLNSYGLKGTFLIIGAFNAHICICGVICKPSSVEILIQKQRRVNNIKETSRKQESNYLSASRKFLSKIFNMNLISNIPFLLFLFSTSTWNLMQSVCLIHLPNYIVRKGFPESAITGIMTVFGVSNTLGRFLAALTAGPGGVDSLMLHVGMLGVAGVATLAFPVYSHFDSAGYIYAAVAGLYTGGPNSVMTPITLQLVGVRDLASAHGLEIFFCGIGVMAGPPIAGFLYEVSDSYENSFMLSGFVVLAGCGLAILSSIKAPSTLTEDLSEESCELSPCELPQSELSPCELPQSELSPCELPQPQSELSPCELSPCELPQPQSELSLCELSSCELPLCKQGPSQDSLSCQTFKTFSGDFSKLSTASEISNLECKQELISTKNDTVS